MRRTLIPLVATILLTNCGGDEGTATYVRANFDGTMWSAPAGDAQLAYTVENPGGGVYIALAARTFGSTQQIFSIGLPNPVVEGTFPLDGIGTYAAYGSCPHNDLLDCAYWRVLSMHPGTMTITAIDTASEVVSGTFSFNGYFLGDSAAAVKAFTGGAFAIRVPGVGGSVIAAPR